MPRPASAIGLSRSWTIPWRQAAVLVGLSLIAVSCSEGSPSATTEPRATRPGYRADGSGSGQRIPTPTIPVLMGFDGGSPSGTTPYLDDVSVAAGVAGGSPAAELDELLAPADLDPAALVAESGVYPILMASQRYQVSGQAWGDFDGDGWIDLYLTSQTGPNRLLRNQQDGTFASASGAADVALPDDESGAAVWVDVDDDGRVDLQVLGIGSQHLFLNLGDGRFRDVTEGSGLEPTVRGQSAAWADIDDDGDLDVAIGDHGCQPCTVDLPVPVADRGRLRLYRNDGDARFTDLTSTIADVPGATAQTFAVGWLDIDGDDDPDLYVANDVRHDRADGDVSIGQEIGPGEMPGNTLLRNDGPGCGGWCFVDVSAASGAGVRADAMGLTIADLDGDGRLDLFHSNSGFRSGPTVLLRGGPEGRFTDVSEEVSANLGEFSWGSGALDLEADGRIDLLLGIGYSELLYQVQRQDLRAEDWADPSSARREVLAGERSFTDQGDIMARWPTAPDPAPRTNNDRLLVQQADGTFEVVLLGSTTSVAPDSYGVSTADYDNDGFTDAVVGHRSVGYTLLHNRGEVGAGNHKLILDLRGDGRRVSRDAAGAIATVTATDGRSHTSSVQVGGGLGSGPERRLAIGLGPASVDRVTVRWPDGTTSVHDDLVDDTLVMIAYDGRTSSSPLAPSTRVGDAQVGP